MPLKYKIILLLVFCIFLFPAKVKAEESLNFYVYSAEADGEFEIYPRNIAFEGSFSELEKLQFLLEGLLNYDGNMLKYISNGTEIRWIMIKNGDAAVSFSSDIKNYGGCYYERALIYQVLKTVFEVSSIETFTLYIDDKIDYLSEGSLIYKFSREEFLNFEKTLKT